MAFIKLHASWLLVNIKDKMLLTGIILDGVSLTAAIGKVDSEIDWHYIDILLPGSPPCNSLLLSLLDHYLNIVLPATLRDSALYLVDRTQRRIDPLIKEPAQ